MPERLGKAVLELSTGGESQYGAGIDRAHTKAKKLDKQFQKVGQTLQNMGKRMTTFVTLPLVGLGAVAAKITGDFEASEIAFTTMLKSAEKATALLDEITEFSAGTPFQFDDLMKGAQRLIAFGTEAEDVVETMRNLGNAAMGNQETLNRITLAYGKLQAKGKATMEELNMFTEAGVPIIQALADRLQVTTGELFKMITAGKIGFPQVQGALEDLTTGSGKFAGIIEEIALSQKGLISTLIDNLKLLGREFGQVLTPVIKEATRRITEWVQALRKLDPQTLKRIAIALAALVATGPGFIVLAGAIKTATAAIATFKAVVMFMSGPAGWITAAVAGVIALAGALAIFIRRTREMNKLIPLSEPQKLSNINYNIRQMIADQELSIAALESLSKRMGITLEVVYQEAVSILNSFGQLTAEEGELFDKLSAKLKEMTKDVATTGDETTQTLLDLTGVLKDVADLFDEIDERLKDSVSQVALLGTRWAKVQTLAPTALFGDPRKAVAREIVSLFESISTEMAIQEASAEGLKGYQKDLVKLYGQAKKILDATVPPAKIPLKTPLPDVQFTAAGLPFGDLGVMGEAKIVRFGRTVQESSKEISGWIGELLDKFPLLSKTMTSMGVDAVAAFGGIEMAFASMASALLSTLKDRLVDVFLRLWDNLRKAVGGEDFGLAVFAEDMKDVASSISSVGRSVASTGETIKHYTPSGRLFMTTPAEEEATAGATMGAGATFTQQRPIDVTINVTDNEVYGGDLREFAQLIRDELVDIGALNL